MNTKGGWGNEIERLHIIKGIVGDAEKSLLFSLHETPKRRGKTEEWKIEYIIDCEGGRNEDSSGEKKKTVFV